MAKKILGYIKLQVKAGSPRRRPRSGPRSVNAASTSWASARSSTPGPKTSPRARPCRP